MSEKYIPFEEQYDVLALRSKFYVNTVHETKYELGEDDASKTLLAAMETATYRQDNFAVAKDNENGYILAGLNEDELGALRPHEYEPSEHINRYKRHGQEYVKARNGHKFTRRQHRNWIDRGLVTGSTISMGAINAVALGVGYSALGLAGGAMVYGSKSIFNNRRSRHLAVGQAELLNDLRDKVLSTSPLDDDRPVNLRLDNDLIVPKVMPWRDDEWRASYLSSMLDAPHEVRSRGGTIERMPTVFRVTRSILWEAGPHQSQELWMTGGLSEAATRTSNAQQSYLQACGRLKAYEKVAKATGESQPDVEAMLSGWNETARQELVIASAGLVNYYDVILNRKREEALLLAMDKIAYQLPDFGKMPCPELSRQLYDLAYTYLLSIDMRDPTEAAHKLKLIINTYNEVNDLLSDPLMYPTLKEHLDKKLHVAVESFSY